MQELGFAIQVDEALTRQFIIPAYRTPLGEEGMPNYACYRTVEETYASAADLAAAYPTLAAWLDIGDSWTRTAFPGSGYDLRVLRLTNSTQPGPKPAVFVMSALHAREYAPAELNLRFAEYLLHSYNLDPDVTWLLDHHEFHLLLQANPDGRKIAEQGLLWRKNTNTNYCSVYPMSRGADLNRNFSFQWGNWGGSSTDPCAETYRGNAAASEPETQAYQAYLSTLYPDLRADSLSTPAPLTTTGVFVDLHSYSNLVLWPWGFHDSPPPNGAALQTLGRKLAFFNAYAPRQAYDLYRTDGTSDDYAYGELGLPAFTIEMGSAFFENCQTFEQTILPDNLEMLVYAGKAARAPYLLPSGPEAVNPQLTPAVVEVGQAVTLTITLDDTRFNQSNGSEPTQAISIAQFTIGVPPWSDAAPSVAAPLIPVDGAFDTTSEDAWALIDTSSAPLGRSLVYVHAQDAAGNWGPVSAAFLTVLPPLKVYLPLVSH